MPRLPVRTVGALTGTATHGALVLKIYSLKWVDTVYLRWHVYRKGERVQFQNDIDIPVFYSMLDLRCAWVRLINWPTTENNATSQHLLCKDVSCKPLLDFSD